MIKSEQSNEEIYFSWYLDELIENGYVVKYKQQPIPFSLSDKITKSYQKTIVLKTKTKVEDKLEIILNKHIYTCDFKILWDIKAYGIFYCYLNDKIKQNSNLVIADKNNISFAETKADYDMNNMTRLFTINQKWVFSKFGIIINLCKLPKHFKDTFTPTKYLFTDKSKKPRKINYKVITLKQYIDAVKALSN